MLPNCPGAMMRLTVFQRGLLGLCAGFLCVPGAILASEPVSAFVGPSAMDVTLDSQGGFSGRYLGEVGEGRLPMDGALISLSQGELQIAETATNRNGQFRLVGIATGVYQLRCGSCCRQVRCWSGELASYANEVQVVRPAFRRAELPLLGSRH